MQQNVVHWNETQEVCMNIFARNVDEKFNTVTIFLQYKNQQYPILKERFTHTKVIGLYI